MGAEVGTPCLLCMEETHTQKRSEAAACEHPALGHGEKTGGQKEEQKMLVAKRNDLTLSGRVVPAHGRKEIFGWNMMWRHQDSLSHKDLGEGCCWQQDVFIYIDTCTKNKP